MKTRRRCAVPDCRHAPNAHGPGGCDLCACAAWLDHKRHDWRDRVTDAWFMATHTWLLQREAVAIGYATEGREFEEHHPRPRLADFMAAMSPGAAPEVLAALTDFDVCRSCRGTGHHRKEAS